MDREKKKGKKMKKQVKRRQDLIKVKEKRNQ